MKLYTEEQVIRMMDLARFTYNSEDKILLSQTPIELPSDEEIEKGAEWLTNGIENISFKDGAKWLKQQITKKNISFKDGAKWLKQHITKTK
jgi:hypothetical protein